MQANLMKTTTLPLFSISNTAKISTFDDKEFQGLTKRKILNKIKYTLENFTTETLISIQAKHPDVYESFVLDFNKSIKNISIKEGSSESLKKEIKKLNNSIDDYSLSFYATLYLIFHTKNGNVLLFKDSLQTENIFEIDTGENAVILFKLLEKGKNFYIQKLEETTFTKRFSKTMFNNENTPLKTLIFTNYKFFLSLPYYTKNTENLSKDAKKLLTMFSKKSNPYKTIINHLPSAFNLNPEKFKKEEYKLFEEKFIKTCKELKYKIDELKEKIKNTFLYSFGSANHEEIRKTISAFSSVDKEIQAVEKALEKENWIELITIIFSKKSVIDLDDNQVQQLIKKIKFFAKRISNLEELYLAEQETPHTKIIKLEFFTGDKSIKKIEKINKEKYENQPLPEIDTSKLTKEQKIKLIQKLIKEI